MLQGVAFVMFCYVPVSDSCSTFVLRVVYSPKLGVASMKLARGATRSGSLKIISSEKCARFFCDCACECPSFMGVRWGVY